VIGRGGLLEVLVVVVLLVLILVELVVLLELRLVDRLLGLRGRLVLLLAEDRRAGQHVDRAAGAVAVGPQRLGEQRGQRPRERVHLVRGERRAVGELGLLVGEDPLEAEQQRVVAPPRR